MKELPNISDGEDKSCPLKNCIRNNYKHIRKWAKRTNTNCFRLYDRHIKEFPLAIDFYDGRILIYFFASYKEEEMPEELEERAIQALSDLLLISKENIYSKSRIRRAKKEQYEKAGNEGDFFPVLEYGVTFLVNLGDYLDTGLFLDHRETRQMVAKLSQSRSLLNLFSYTSSFSVHAAFHGAAFTKSVDMSNTYIDWSRRNFELNKLSLETNELVRADCLKFLEEERRTYDLIVIDPPTISRSKKMEEMFDVQRDYPFLIEKALGLLNKGGTLFFSTNLRSFKFDMVRFPNAKEITAKTIPLDFHNQKIHYCWTLS
jgi:23S rRNA (cytosine1962-C5)-methyltransferase